MDVFLHINVVKAIWPDDFPGLPAVEFKLGENTVRLWATWARVVGPALPMDKVKVPASSLSSVLKRPAEQIRESNPNKAGWLRLLDVLGMDQLQASVNAHTREGAIPESLVNSLHDLAVCVMAPTHAVVDAFIGWPCPRIADSEHASEFHLRLE